MTATSARERPAAYQIVAERDGGVCQRCHRPCGPVERDHRKNRSQGGLTVASNLQLLGLACHEWKTSHPRAAVAEGWAVPGWPAADPAAWPARRWVRDEFGVMRQLWVLYDNAGGVTPVTDEDAAHRMAAMGFDGESD